MFTFFYNYKKQLNQYFNNQFQKNLPIHEDTYLELVFTFEYVVFSSMILIPITIIFIKYILPYIVKIARNNSNILFNLLLLLLLQTFITIVIHRIKKLITGFPSIITLNKDTDLFNKDADRLKKIKNDSVMTGYMISSHIFMLMALPIRQILDIKAFDININAM